jgi:hypothetical protein
MDGQEFCHCYARGGLARDEQVQRLEALALLRVLLRSESSLQRFRAFGNRRQCFVHRSF